MTNPQKYFRAMLPVAVLAIGCLLYGCEQDGKAVKQTEIARFGNGVLTLNQINVPQNLSAQDSLDFIKKKANEWIIRQAMAEKAFENIDDNDKSLENKVNEYRTTLYIHNYKQKLVDQKVDTMVSIRQIEEYFNKYGDEFRLSFPLVKAWVIMVPVSMTNQEVLLKYLRSSDDNILGDLKELCFQSARYFNFDTNWRTLPSILSETSLTIQTINGDNLGKEKIFQFKRNEIEIFVKIIDFLRAGDKPPLESVSNQIKEIIIQKRKEQFLNRLENDLLQNAKSQSKAIIRI
jgi:hypothetical protein